MIHKYRLNDINIVLDVNSGAVHVVEDIVFDMLDSIEPPLDDSQMDLIIEKSGDKYSKAQLELAYAEIRELYDKGILFSDDYTDELTGFMTDSPVKALCLHVSHDCNLRCEYCFASTGDFGGERELLSSDTGKKAIDFLIKHSRNRRNLEIDFFGGEPLMNFDAVKELVDYCRLKEKEHNKNIRLTLTTNGLLLDDEKIEYLNENMYNLVLSIDGRPEVNDRMRKNLAGKGSYNLIKDKFLKMARLRGDRFYYVRGTFTKYNLDFTEDVIHLADQGFNQISVEPVISDPDLPYSITMEDLPEIFSEYEKLANIIINRKNKFNFFHFMIDLEQGPCAVKRLRGCGAGNEYLAIAPNGDIYPCHQFVGYRDWCMGNVADGSLDLELKNKFAKSNIYSKPDCIKCWAKFYCSGGCNANNFRYNGDINKPMELSCEMTKKRIECAILIKIMLANSNIL